MMFLNAGKPGPTIMKPRTRKNGSASTSAQPTREEIASRAYEVYVRKGQAEGHDLENWLEAEAELKQERNGGSQHRTEAQLG